MANCFSGYIGLKGCGATIPASGLWVNSLPGISTELADKIANADQITFAGVWKDVQTIAKEQLLNDLVNGLSEKINFHQVVYQTKRPRPSRIRENIPASLDYRGVLIEAPESRYSQIRVKTLFVYSATAGDTTIKVWNVFDGSAVFTKAVTLTIGLNEISIDTAFDLTFSDNSIFIGIDCTAIDTIYFLQQNEDYWDWYNDDCPINNYGYNDQVLRIQAAAMATNDLPDYSTIIRTGKPIGVWVSAEIICSAEAYLCENLHHLKATVLYLLGWQMLLYKVASPRMNFFTYHKEDVTEKLMVEFKEQYTSNIKRTLAAIPVSGSGYCFDCDERNLYAQGGSMP